MKIKAIVVDFDGTITTADVLGLLCDLVGKKADSEEIDRLFQEGKIGALPSLVERISFLKGLSIEQIQGIVSQDRYFQKGARELFKFLRENKVISIIASGNVVQLLDVYKEELGADYVVGSRPVIENGQIVSISEEDYPGPDFKVQGLKGILNQLDIPLDSLVAIGDSLADKGIFELAARSIAINPKGGIEKYADYVIEKDLSLAVPILKGLMESQEINKEKRLGLA